MSAAPPPEDKDNEGKAAPQIDGTSILHFEDLKKTIAGTGVNFIGSIVRTVLLFLYAVFLAAFLDPGSVGLYFLGITVITLLGTAATLGLDTGVLRFTALYNGEGDSDRVRGTIAGAVWVVAPVGLIIGLFLFLFAGSLAEDVFGKPELGAVLRMFAPAVPLYALARLFNSGTQGQGQMRYQVYSRDFGEQTIKLIVSGGLLVGGLGLLGVVGANLIALAIATLLSLTFLHKVKPVFGTHLKRIYEQKRLFRYSMPLAVSALLAFALTWIDTLFLGYYRPAEDVGTYGVAMRIAVVGSVIMLSFNTMFAPLVSSFYNRRERERLESLLKSVTKWIAVLSFPIFSAFIIFPEQALRIMGSHYTVGATALVILSVGKLVDSAAGPVVLMLMMCGRPRIVMANSIIIFAIDVCLCVFLIPRYGISGAALASAFTIALVNISALAGVTLLLKLQPFSLNYVKVVMATLISAGSAFTLKQLMPYPWNLIAGFSVFIVSYVFIIVSTAIDSSDLAVAAAIKERITGR